MFSSNRSMPSAETRLIRLAHYNLPFLAAGGEGGVEPVGDGWEGQDGPVGQERVCAEVSYRGPTSCDGVGLERDEVEREAGAGCFND